jgi:hypothetical protein
LISNCCEFQYRDTRVMTMSTEGDSLNKAENGKS